MALAFEQWMAQMRAQDSLNVVTCGSVDDGKSTLMGHLLFLTGNVPRDQLDSARDAQGQIDFALLFDGLRAEREQGITIDVAYRHLQTPQRHFLIADCPGHEQYTRNMVTGASQAQAGVLLVDARKGVREQTRRHVFILKLLGVRHLIVAINKMDRVDYAQPHFAALSGELQAMAEQMQFGALTLIPTSGLHGDGLTSPSTNMPWYQGPDLLQALQSVPAMDSEVGSARFPVQAVIRPHQDFRGYQGQLVQGQLRVGDAIQVQPSGTSAHIEQIILGAQKLECAAARQSVTLTLDRELDISRGDVIVNAAAPLEIADQFAAHLIVLQEKPLLAGRSYWLQIGTRRCKASITLIKHKIDVNTQAELAASALALNEIGVCNISLDQMIAFAPYAQSRDLGGFILIDRQSNQTVAAGMIQFALRRASNIHWQALQLTPQLRAQSLGQRPGVIWFTGLSGAGKSTIADLLEQKLHAHQRHCFILDGDNVRHGLNRDLGFSQADRVENIRRIAEVAKLMCDAGLIVIVSAISPYAAERQMAREIIGSERFTEVFVDTPLAEVMRRDTKGLYAKAMRGEISNFTGIDAPYEAPLRADLVLVTLDADADQLADRVLKTIL